jgi:MSHA pilin protein MshD
MSMTSLRQRGFTLIELIIFIVVVAAGLAGILSVMNTVVKSSADPMIRKQAAALAESVLEEIMLKNYNDPDGMPNVVEADRTLWDSVEDYRGQTNAALGVPLALNAYSVGIAVDPDTSVVGTVAKPAWKVAVTVARAPETITLTGYRTCYGEVDDTTGLSTCP